MQHRNGKVNVNGKHGYQGRTLGLLPLIAMGGATGCAVEEADEIAAEDQPIHAESSIETGPTRHIFEAVPTPCAADTVAACGNMIVGLDVGAEVIYARTLHRPYHLMVLDDRFLPLDPEVLHLPEGTTFHIVQGPDLVEQWRQSSDFEPHAAAPVRMVDRYLSEGDDEDFVLSEGDIAWQATGITAAEVGASLSVIDATYMAGSVGYYYAWQVPLDNETASCQGKELKNEGGFVSKRTNFAYPATDARAYTYTGQQIGVFSTGLFGTIAAVANVHASWFRDYYLSVATAVGDECN